VKEHKGTKNFSAYSEIEKDSKKYKKILKE
jgi:hypothetical protein